MLLIMPDSRRFELHCPERRLLLICHYVWHELSDRQLAEAQAVFEEIATRVDLHHHTITLEVMIEPPDNNAWMLITDSDQTGQASTIPCLLQNGVPGGPIDWPCLVKMALYRVAGRDPNEDNRQKLGWLCHRYRAALLTCYRRINDRRIWLPTWLRRWIRDHLLRVITKFNATNKQPESL